MSNTFHTRIPTLSEAELRRYLQFHRKYKAEAVEAAVAELRRRGHEVSDVEWEGIRESLNQRDVAKNGTHAGSKPGLFHDGTKPRTGRIRAATAAILAIGLGSAAVIYRLAASAAAAGIDLESEDSKKYLRDLEVIGGKANVIASEIRHWLIECCQGKSLAYTVAWSSVLLATAFWFAASHGRAGRSR